MAFNAISSLTSLMVGFSPAAGAGGDFLNGFSVQLHPQVITFGLDIRQPTK
jgi:hypothetical protein